MSSNAAWLHSLGPVLARQKLEDSAFKSYCEQRDRGFGADYLKRFFGPYDRFSDFESRYVHEAALAQAEKDPLRGFTYQPPIESACYHGKTVGPCPQCSAEISHEQRQAREA